MTEHGALTISEILSQPASWAGAFESAIGRAPEIQGLLASYADHPWILSGCGSPYYLTLSIASLIRQYAGHACLATPASEIVFQPRTVFSDQDAPLLIVFSRSGETSESIAAARAIQQRGGAVLAVGCDAGTTLMRMADLAVEVAAGREDSVVQTRSFAGMLVAGLAIVGLAAGTQGAHGLGLPELVSAGPAYLKRAHAAAQGMPGALARNLEIDRVFVLGAGARYGLACEAALKFQEMSLTNAASYHPLEFRHGPMSLADERALVIGLLGTETIDAELAVLRQVQGMGARVIALAECLDADDLNGVFALESGVPDPARDVLYLAPLQLMAYERARAKGIDPDAPRNLSSFITLDGLNG